MMPEGKNNLGERDKFVKTSNYYPQKYQDDILSIKQ